MGQIQNAINQVFASGIGASLAVSHSPYVKEKNFQKEGARKLTSINERVSQLHEHQKMDEVYPDVSKPLTLGGAEANMTRKPEKLERVLKDYEEGKIDPEKISELNARIKTETSSAMKGYRDYFKEERDLAEEYNVLQARLGSTERMDLGQIAQREEALAQRISESLRSAYTTKEGIIKTAQMRREFIAEERRRLNDGK